MFSGWRLVNDIETLAKLGQGHLELDFLEGTTKFNDKLIETELKMLTEIMNWFDKDLTDNNVDKKSILNATLNVDFVLTSTVGKLKSRTKKRTKLELKMISIVLTDKRDYSVKKERTLEYHYIDKRGL